MTDREYIIQQLKDVIAEDMNTTKERLEAMRLLSQIEGFIPSDNEKATSK